MQTQTYKLSQSIPPSPKTIRGEPSSIDVNQNYILYFNGSTVILRPHNAESPLLYIVHSSQVNAVKFSHDGKLVASIDSKGTLLINEVCADKLILTKTYQNMYSGAKSIDWSSDRKKLCVVGSGKNQFGRIISVDMGTNVGQISGVSSNLNSASFHTKKNNRLVVGGDQYTIKIFEGPPFKFIRSNKTHTGYINQIKYSPNGTLFLSAGADRRLVLYDGQSCQKVVEKENAHNGGVMGVDWIDSQHFVTVSSDKFIRIWDTKLNQINNIPAATEAQMSNPKSINKALLGVRYYNDKIYCVCLDGDILIIQNPLKMKDGKKELLVGVRGKPIKTISFNQQKFIIVDNYGRIILHEGYKLPLKSIQGDKDIKLILGASCDSSNLYVLLGDNNVFKYDLKSYQYLDQYKVDGAKFITSLQKGFVCASNVLLTQHHNDQIMNKANLQQQPTILVGQHNQLGVGSQKGSIWIFSINMDLLVKFSNSQTRISQILFYNSLIFIGDSTGKIKVWQRKQKEVLQKDSKFGNHTSVITSISIQKGFIYTFGLDNKLNVWTLDGYKRVDQAIQIHKGGILHGFVIGNNIISCGSDLIVKIHKIYN